MCGNAVCGCAVRCPEGLRLSGKANRIRGYAPWWVGVAPNDHGKGLPVGQSRHRTSDAEAATRSFQFAAVPFGWHSRIAERKRDKHFYDRL